MLKLELQTKAVSHAGPLSCTCHRSPRDEIIPAISPTVVLENVDADAGWPEPPPLDHSAEDSAGYATILVATAIEMMGRLKHFNS
jgi:hypothetical protein